MVYVLITAGIFLLELVIKNHVEKKEKLNTTKEVLGGKLLLRKHHNRGFALNIGQKKPKMVAGVSLVLCIFVTIFSFLTLGKGNRCTKAGLSILLGGAYSNTYDRLFRRYVVDYFSLGVKNKRLRRIIFNLADFCIMIGTILAVAGGICGENLGEGQICGTCDGGFGGTQ